MSSLMSTLLSRSQNQVSTRQALMIVGLQNDFTSPDGKLPVNSATGYLDRIRELVPAFRDHGEIFWITSQYRAVRPVNNSSGTGCMVVASEDAHVSASASGHRPQKTGTIDPDLFLSQPNIQDNCCLPGSWGAELSPQITDLVSPRDVQVVKSYYSAFTASSLLLMLRAKLITEVYVVGCTTNLSVYATALDAAQHGLSINLVEDCLNYRIKERHDRAIYDLVEMMGASVTTSASVLSRLRGEPEADDSANESRAGQSDEDSKDQPVRASYLLDDSRAALANMKLSNTLPTTASARSLPKSSVEHAKPPGIETSDARSERVGSDMSYSGSRRYHDDRNIDLKPDVVPNAMGANQASRLDQSLSGVDDLRREAPFHTSDNPSLPNNGQTHARGFGQDESSFKTPSTIETPKTIIGSRRKDVQRTSSTTENVPARVARKPQMRRKEKRLPLTILGPGDDIGNGDTEIIHDLLEPSIADTVFQTLYNEVHWQRMYHVEGEVPRLVCCQGDIDPQDGSMPVYRHPSDQSLPLLHWSPTVAKIRRRAEETVGHKLNHVLIQLYRDGQDHISEHSDKTLDVVHDSKIVNFSIGAERTMRLRTKRPEGEKSSKRSEAHHGQPSSTSPSHDETRSEQSRSRASQRIPMPHNSMFVMGLLTNSTWLHGIKPDKRLPAERSAAELAYGGMRISLTFRQIGTFLSADSKLIWGQGATSKLKKDARLTSNGDSERSQKMIDAFGVENQSTTFDWNKCYGHGFDVLHLKTALPDQELPMLFLSDDVCADQGIQLYLTHLDLEADIVAPSTSQLSANMTDAKGDPLLPTTAARQICFRDADMLHTHVEGNIPILLFLDRFHNRDTAATRSQKATELELLMSPTLDILQTGVMNDATTAALRLLEDMLKLRSEGERDTHGWLAGRVFGMADCAYWPLINQIKTRSSDFNKMFPALGAWTRNMESKQVI